MSGAADGGLIQDKTRGKAGESSCSGREAGLQKTTTGEREGGAQQHSRAD